MKKASPGSSPSNDFGNIDDGLLLIQGGSFTMGSPESEPWRGSDETQHQVTLSSFYLSPTEVTQAEYAQLMGGSASGAAAAAGMTWYQAVEYCNKLSEAQGLTPAYAIDGESVSWDLAANGYRLPTEAEWEYACRAGTTTPFNTENSISADTQANYYGTYPYEIEDNYFSQSNLETAPGVYRQEPIEPGSFSANNWGLYDMHGNVAEWVWDIYGAYDTAEATDPTGPAQGDLRVNRGGGWNDFAKNLRSAYRAALPANGSSASVGFRVARSARAGQGVVGDAAAPAQAQVEAGAKGIIVYFTWSGNTRGIAQEVSRQTGYEAVELQLEEPYSSDYSTCLEQAQHDQNVQARPALSTKVDNFDQYSVVLLGYPNWWASIPMPIASFLETYDCAGKSILPFASNGGGGLGQSVSAISKLAPQATVHDGLSIYYSGGSTLSADVEAWLKSRGVL